MRELIQNPTPEIKKPKASGLRQLLVIGATALLPAAACGSEITAQDKTLGACDADIAFTEKGGDEPIADMDQELETVRANVNSLHARAEQSGGEMEFRDESDWDKSYYVVAQDSELELRFESYRTGGAHDTVRFPVGEDSQDISIGAIACTLEGQVYPTRTNIVLDETVAATEGINQTFMDYPSEFEDNRSYRGGTLYSDEPLEKLVYVEEEFIALTPLAALVLATFIDT